MSIENIKVSVIIPVYNAQETIEKCLDSVLAQTLSPIEIIVIDDGSTDNTPSILKQYEGKIILLEQERQGQGIARNKGLDIAKGEFVGFVDADDFISPEMYLEMYNKAVEYEVQIVQCEMTKLYPDSAFNVKIGRFHGLVEIIDTSDYLSHYIFHFIHTAECCNKLINRAFIEENKFRFEDNEKIFAEDLLFNLQMTIALNKIYFIEEAYYTYTQNPNAHSKQRSPEKVFKIFGLFNSFYDSLPTKELKKSLSKFAVLIIMINLSHVLHTEEGKDMGRKILKNKKTKEMIRNTFVKMPKLRHKIIMFLLLTLPMHLKLMLVKCYYLNMR